MAEPSFLKKEDIHVLIIGAGVTGLLIAHGLKQAGIGSSIFEAEPVATHYRPREWSMGIHWALPQLEELLPPDLKARLKEPQNDPFLDPPDKDVFRIYNGLTGKILKDLPMPKTMRMSRRRMRKFCSEGIDVRYGHELESIRYHSDKRGVTAIFKNQIAVTGTLLIGADGPKSTVRELLLGPEKSSTTQMEIVHTDIGVTYHDAEKAKLIRSTHPVFSIAVHPDVLVLTSIQDVPSPEDPANWRFRIVTSWLGKPDESLDNASRVADLKKRTSVICEPFRSAVAWMPDDTKITYNKIAYWIPIPWDNRNGCVTLAGDAAHPMTPHRGQGLNHAICDVSNLVGAIQSAIKGTASMEHAITSYDREVVERGGAEVLISKQNAIMMLNWDQLMDSPMMKRSLHKVNTGI